MKTLLESLDTANLYPRMEMGCI